MPQLPVLLDLTKRAEQIVAKTIFRLALPRFSLGQTFESAAMLVSDILTELGVPLDRLLRSLNTPFHYEFKSLVQRLTIRRQPVTTEIFERWVLSSKENTPRHAASLFLVSHFGRLTPAQFMELGDLLAGETPSLQQSANQERPPSRVTDQVLRECGIRFMMTGKRELVSMLGVDGGLAASSDISQDEAVSVEATIRDAFDREAALLKERYLAALAIRLTLGHASGLIADRYASLELEALDMTEAIEPSAVAERLRRIVFGYPAVIGAVEGYLAANRPSLQAALRRAVPRVPALVQGMAARQTGVPIPQLVAELCSAEPVDPDKSWVSIFHEVATRLFWLFYSGDPINVTLHGLVALFERNAVERRAEALDNLQRIFDDADADPLLRPIKPRFREPLLLAQLLRDISADFRNIVHQDDDPFRVDLLMLVATEYLRRGLWRTLWRDVCAWTDGRDGAASIPVDRAVASALFARETGIWLSDPASHLEPAVERAPDSRSALYKVSRRAWLMARMAIDGLVGSGGFGDYEGVALDVGLQGFLELPFTWPPGTGSTPTSFGYDCAIRHTTPMSRRSTSPSGMWRPRFTQWCRS